MNTVKMATESGDIAGSKVSVLRPYHDSRPCSNLDETRRFYEVILGGEVKRPKGQSKFRSMHVDFFGNQLTFHEVVGFDASTNFYAIEAEDVPVPHHGVSLTLDELRDVEAKLNSVAWPISIPLAERFIDKHYRQWAMFV